jgi:hypothetical protein
MVKVIVTGLIGVELVVSAVTEMLPIGPITASPESPVWGAKIPALLEVSIQALGAVGVKYSTNGTAPPLVVGRAITATHPLDVIVKDSFAPDGVNRLVNG